MLTQLLFAGKDIWRKPVVFVFFVIQLVVSTFFGFLSLDQAATFARNIKSVGNVTNSHIVFFSPTLETLIQRRITQGGNDLLVNTLDGGLRAYSTVLSARLQDHPKLDLVVGLGEFADVFQLEGSISDLVKPVVLVGHNVVHLQVGDTVRFGELNTASLTVGRRLPQGASYILRATPTSLDDSVVILTDVESMLTHYYRGFQHFDEILVNLSLINPTGSEMSQFVASVLREVGVAVNPMDLNTYSRQRQGDAFYGALFFLAFFGITLAYVLVGIVANILMLLESHMSEYAIHLLSGAQMRHLYSRVVIYIALLVVPPLLLVSMLLLLMHQTPLVRIISVIPPAIVLVIVLAGIPVLRLRKADLSAYLRSDDAWH